MPLRGDRWSKLHIDYDSFWRVGSPKDVQHTNQGVYSFIGEVDENNYGTIAQIRTIEPMLVPGVKGRAQFEVRIISTGAQNSITVGFCSKNYKEDDILPGWSDDSGTAIAVDALEGRLYHNSDDGEPLFCTCMVGDVIRCVLTPLSGSASVLVEFLCNDRRITKITADLPADGFHGVVAMASKGEKVRLSPPEREEFEPIDSRFVVRSGNAAHEGDGLFVYIVPDRLPKSPDADFSYNIGTVRSKLPIDPMNSQLRTLQVQLVDPGELCGIAIGVCSSDYSLESMPGWAENSIAYHLDIRSILYGEEEGDQERVAPLSVSDVLHVILEPVDGSSKEVMVFFRKNSELLGKRKMWNPRGGFYWCIAMTSEGEKVRVLPTHSNMVPIKQVQKMRFEELWELPTPDIDLTSKGICAYVGHGGERHIGSIRSRQPLDPHDPNAYFEVKIINPGHACSIAIGVCSRHYPHSLLPGWQSKSVGFHCDTGGVYHNSTPSQETDRPCRGGDIIRCSVESVDGSLKQVSISFYHNGVLVNTETEWVSSEGMYAAVGMMSRGEVIQLACPKMDPPSLKRGLEGLPSSLTKPEKPLTFPLKKLSASYHPQRSCPPEQLSVWKPGTSEYHQPSFSSALSAPALGPPLAHDHDDKGFYEESDLPFSEEVVSEGPTIPSAVQWLGQFSSLSSLPPISVTACDGGEFIAESEDQVDTFATPVPSLSPLPPGDVCAQQINQLHLLPQVPKNDCHLFQVLHNLKASTPVADDADKSSSFPTIPGLTLECSPEARHGVALSRTPLSEKMPYFEAELLVDGSDNGTRIGVIWTEDTLIQHPVSNRPQQSLSPRYGYVLFHVATGELLTCIAGEQRMNSLLYLPCAKGDVIGCTASLLYKSEESQTPTDRNMVNTYQPQPKTATLRFYKNAMPVADTTVPLYSSGVSPFVYLTQGSMVLFKKGYALSPLDYFDKHSVPEGYLNFPLPNPLDICSGWRDLQDCSLEETTTGVTISLKPSTSSSRTMGKPGIIQHCLPFTRSSSYCEIQLLCSATNYTVLCIGAMGLIEANTDLTLPGDSRDSVGCSPLLGIVMRGGAQVARIPETTVDQLRDKEECFWLGVGADFVSSPDSISASSNGQRSVEIFFTIDFQEVARLLTPIPQGGLFPTIAILTENVKDVPSSRGDLNKVANTFFPRTWPSTSSRTLPCGVGRISSTCGPCTASHVFNSTSSDVSGIQGCSPILPSNPYFEATICTVGKSGEVSVGLAPLAYSLNIHVGVQAPSIAYMSNTGCIVHNGSVQPVSPVFMHPGVKIGCGVVFPSDGSRGTVEVIFAVNEQVVARRLVRVPSSGLFPTIAMNTPGGYVSFDFSAPNPFCDSPFQLMWHKLDNILATHSSLQLISHAHIGIAQLARPTSLLANQSNYFKISLESKLTSGKVFVGLSNSTDSPFSPRVHVKNCSYFLEVSSGMVIITQRGNRKSDECSVAGASEFGCGVYPVPNTNSLLLFFTLDNQAVYSAEIDVLDDLLYPCVCMVGCSIQVQVDPGALWPPLTTIGRGWGRHQCLEYSFGSLSHLCSQSGPPSRDGIGFAQACMPLTPSNTYFEVEILERNSKKAIAIGLACRQYSMANWIGSKYGSIAYHADDGHLFKATVNSISYGPKYGEGDIAGCGIFFNIENHTAAMSGGSRVDVFFTINGVLLGIQKMTIPPQGLFPTICLESPSERVCVKLQCQFPPYLERMSDRWARSFCVMQMGHVLKHTFRTKSDFKESNCPKAFCQAKDPMSVHSYFEVDIAQYDSTSLLSIGAAPLQGDQSTELPQEAVLFNCRGQITTMTSDGKASMVSTRQRCSAGDVMGCCVEGSSLVSFYLNRTLVSSCPLPSSFASKPLHPTIILTHPNDMVIPSLGALRPVSHNHYFIGWLRSERMKIKKSNLEYESKAAVHVGVAQISQSMTSSLPYYEIEVLSLGEKGTIAVGAAAVDHYLARQPGWVRRSIGYHGDDGKLFHHSGTGVSFGPSWRLHDTVGIGIRKHTRHVTDDDEVQVFFTRNGVELGHTTMKVPESGLFPTIGMHSVGEMVKVNAKVKQQFSADRSRLKWRTLVGVEFFYSLRQRKHFLSFCCNGRVHPTLASELQDGIGFAMSHQQFSEKLQYFEVEVLNLGKLKAVAVGAAPKNYSPEHVIGWVFESVAYHTDNGYLYHASGQGKPFGPVGKEGDVIGCGVSFMSSSSRHCSVFFTHNGIEIGRVRCAIPEHGFYPAISLCSPNDRVSVCFKESFKPTISLPSDIFIIGLMRSHNCSYSDQILKYSGGSSGGFAKAQFNIALANSRNYYAANIITKEEDAILIGLATRDYPESHLPGESSFSVAYNISKGMVKAVCGHTIQNLPARKCRVGDTVGCGIQWAVESKDPPSVFFTKNGVIVSQLQLPNFDEDLFPIIGIIPKTRRSVLRMDWSNHQFSAQNEL